MKRTFSQMDVDTNLATTQIIGRPKRKPTLKRQARMPMVRARMRVPLNPIQRAQVQRIIDRNQEEKYLIRNTSAFAISSTGAIFQISDVGVGTSDVTRVGDQVKWLMFHIRGGWLIGDTTQLVRLIVFQWKPNSTPTILSILLTGPAGAAPEVFSQYNHDLRSQYTILSDETWHLEGNGSAATDPTTPNTQACFRHSIVVPHKQAQYSGGTTNGTNQIWYIAISDSAAATHPALTFQSKCTFHDA